MGMKTTYTEEMANEICDWLSEGKPLAQFCAQKGKPSYRTVYDWLDAFPDFSARYARARETGFDIIADDCLSIADEMPPTTEKGGTDSGFVAWQRNRIYTRERLLRAWSPKKYGDAKQIEVSGPNGGPIQTQTTVLDPAAMDPDARDALRYALTAAARASQSDDRPFEDDDEDSE